MTCSAHDPFVRFIVDKLMLGAGLGVSLALIMLLTDAFGLYTLISGEADRLGAVLAFLVGGVMIFTPITLAAAVGLARAGE